MNAPLHPSPASYVINLYAAVSNASDFPKVRVQSYYFFSHTSTFLDGKML